MPSKVRNLTITALNSTSLLVTWSPPAQRNGTLQGYNIIVRNYYKKFLHSLTSITVIQWSILFADFLIGHLRVSGFACVKTCLCVKPIIWKSVPPASSFPCKPIHFHLKGFTWGLVLKRDEQARKRSIVILLLHNLCVEFCLWLTALLFVFWIRMIFFVTAR